MVAAPDMIQSSGLRPLPPSIPRNHSAQNTARYDTPVKHATDRSTQPISGPKSTCPPLRSRLGDSLVRQSVGFLRREIGPSSRLPHHLEEASASEITLLLPLTVRIDWNQHRDRRATPFDDDAFIARADRVEKRSKT